MSVNDQQVIRIYAQASEQARLSGYRGLAAIERTFRILKARRDQPGMSVDLNLAAAEWYAFARYSVATGFVSSFQMSILAYAYYAKKVYDSSTGDPNAEAVTSNPVSDPDSGVAKWGAAGATQGAIDRVSYKTEVTPPAWRSVDSILGSSDGGYRAVGTETN